MEEQPEVSFYVQNLFAFIHFISHGNPTEGLIQHTFFVSPVNLFSMQILVGGTLQCWPHHRKKKNSNTAKRSLKIPQCYNLAGCFILAITMQGSFLLKNQIFHGVFQKMPLKNFVQLNIRSRYIRFPTDITNKFQHSDWISVEIDQQRWKFFNPLFPRGVGTLP